MNIYLVAWSGGYERPSYRAFTDKVAAIKQAKEWLDDTDQDHGPDWIDVLELSLPSLLLQTVASNGEIDAAYEMIMELERLKEEELESL